MNVLLARSPAVVIGVIIALSVLMTGFSEKKTNFDDLALGKETYSLYASLDGIPIHCKHLEDAHYWLTKQCKNLY